MMNEISQAEFWENHILPWERSRYSKLAAFNPFSWTVRSRARRAREATLPLLFPGIRILELGCGSGHFARSLPMPEGSSYLGIDLSSKAIRQAQSLSIGAHANLKFQIGDIRSLPRIESDLVIFLGLVDWLSSHEVETVLKAIAAPKILFSFTESKRGFSRVFYRFYRSFLGIRDQSSPARSYSEEEITQMMNAAGFEKTRVDASFGMGPGRLALGWRTLNA
jgi:SAM-dependent methyltransferase